MRLIPRVLALFLSCLLFASPAIANEAIETQPIAQGQLVYPADIAQWPETSRNETGLAITSLLGVQNLLPAVNPLAISLSGSAMTFTIGGGSQTIIAQDSTSGGSGNTRLIDSCPPQTITVPANSTGSTRNDLLSIEYNQLATNPHSVPFSNNTTQTVSNALESCLYSYNTATSSPPTNYVAFAHVAVPNGATLASQATVSYIFPTVASQLATVLGGVVDSVNGQRGTVTLAQGNGILVTTAGGTITTTLSTPVSTANGGNGTGVPSLTPGTNLSSSGSWAAQTLNVVNNPTFSGLVTASNGLTVTGTTSTGSLNTAAITASGIVYATNSSAAFQWANAAGSPSQTTLVGNGGFQVPTGTGYTDSAMGLINQGGINLLALDTSGDLGLAGGIKVANASTFSNAVSMTALTATTGTFSGLVNTTNASGGYQFSNTSGGSNQTTLVGNSGFTVRGVTDDLLGIIGQGVSSPIAIDHNGTVGMAGLFATTGNFNNAVSMTALTATTGTFSGAATSPTIPKIYLNGTQLTSSPHIEIFTSQSINSNQTLTLNFGTAFSSNGNYGCGEIGTAGGASAPMYLTNESAGSLQIFNPAGNGGTAFQLLCAGQ